MMDMMNWLDLYQNFHTLFSRQHISIQIPLDHKTVVFQPQYKFENNNCEFSLDRLHLLFVHSCEAVLRTRKTTAFRATKLNFSLGHLLCDFGQDT